MMAVRRLLALALVLAAVAVEIDGLTEEELRKAIRMKTSRQLKAVFEELDEDIPPKTSKAALRDLAFETPAIAEHIGLQALEKKKTKKAPPSGGGFDGMEVPEGMDPAQWANLMASMRGDYSAERDLEKRAILERLRAKGINFGGAAGMDIDMLRKMEAAMSKGFSGDASSNDDAEASEASGGDDEVDLDKDEL
mmetsp:Transcript_13679/g.26105  ORF Transcript_13679/g.26105 Transcript_13679/m.26105 type:complete len:194 (-) Transcript_13679:106-687(-)